MSFYNSQLQPCNQVFFFYSAVLVAFTKVKNLHPNKQLIEIHE